MFAGAVCQWHTFSTDRSGAETLRDRFFCGAIRAALYLADFSRKKTETSFQLLSFYLFCKTEKISAGPFLSV